MQSRSTKQFPFETPPHFPTMLKYLETFFRLNTREKLKDRDILNVFKVYIYMGRSEMMEYLF